MFISFSTVNFDTEFRIPPGCRPSGAVDCRVVRARCVVIRQFREWVTFKVILVLEIRIRSGHRTCRFFKEIAAKETVWLDVDKRIRACDVVAAACRCVTNRGRVHCSLTVKVRFFLEHKFRDPCMPFRRHHGSGDWDRLDGDVGVWEEGEAVHDGTGNDWSQGTGSGGDSSGDSSSGDGWSGGSWSGYPSHGKQDDGGRRSMRSTASRSK
jgi:uncharacterized membrane protein YgcG